MSALDGLPEYSLTLPTGTTIGKRWKRDNNAFKRPVRVEILGLLFVLPWPPEWWIGEYVEHADPKRVGIKWTKVEL